MNAMEKHPNHELQKSQATSPTYTHVDAPCTRTAVQQPTTSPATAPRQVAPCQPNTPNFVEPTDFVRTQVRQTPEPRTEQDDHGCARMHGHMARDKRLIEQETETTTKAAIHTPKTWPRHPQPPLTSLAARLVCKLLFKLQISTLPHAAPGGRWTNAYMRNHATQGYTAEPCGV